MFDQVMFGSVVFGLASWGVALCGTFLSGCGAGSPAPIATAVVATQGTVEIEGDVAGCALPDVDPGSVQRNLAGAELAPCGSTRRTGFYREGRCTTGPDDHGVHVVCAEVTEAFLSFTAAQGNDLSTPRGSFPGLEEGDAWCLCASRWAEAYEAGVAPPVVIAATHERALEFVSREALETHAR
jgi:uncharacterized protein (DUF2237 family)